MGEGDVREQSLSIVAAASLNFKVYNDIKVSRDFIVNIKNLGHYLQINQLGEGPDLGEAPAVYLGTFNEEVEAYYAYDVAAQPFREASLQHPVHDADAESELAFLSTRSKSEIIDMLCKHTYLDELAKSCCLTCSSSATPRRYHVNCDGGVSTQRDLN
ncbi:hypothetical protein QJS10_CPB22g00036 [Acorus calamus]|uniref:Uncharacterized protein n=1 Tax=Acorus calamus TaxID=4465 RepID=A0AAV9BYR0_ACOCL|nr:hypothetical protein QJS10_CPB22g00036 [Acorus calamus]